MILSKLEGKRVREFLNLPLVAALALAVGVGVPPARAQQNQSGPDPAAVAPPDGAPQQPADVPPPAPPQGQPDAQVPPPPPMPQAQANQAPPPATLTLPAGTVIRLRVYDWISSDRNVIGDSFSGELAQPIVVDGWVVARRGQSESGRVTSVKKGSGGGTSQLGLDMNTVTLVDGQQLALQTKLYQASGNGNASVNGRDVATVGGTTGLGAVIGGIAGGGTGAAIGAGLGATAGIIGVMSTKGRPTVIAPESVLTFRLDAPVTISTGNSQFAFQPVKQSDYDSRSPQDRPRMTRPGPPPPPPYYPYPYAYAYPYYPYPYGWYGGPYFGYYGRWR